jgi:oxygen-dependent protoporphyrinogen oxidase
MTNRIDTLIVGAGISGLSVAHALQKAAKSPLKILVTEAQNRVGGNITTAKEGEFLWEEGPNSFAPTPEILQLAVEVGLKSELVFADHKLPRYVYWQGQLMPVPMNPKTMISSRLLSEGGKLRALLGAIGFVPPVMANDVANQNGEETVAQFFQRHLGTEVLQRLVEPFVSGVFAGNTQLLSANSAFAKVGKMAEVGGGLLAGAILSRRRQPKPVVNPNIPKTKPGQLCSFRQGLESLPRAIAQQLGDVVQLNWRLEKLTQTTDKIYLAEFSTPNGRQIVEAKTVVLTTPSYVNSQWFRELSPTMAETFSQFYYPPVACVVLAYPDQAFKVKLDGFGNLIPRSQGVQTLGSIWSSVLFPGRCPHGWQMISNFIGGATNPGILQQVALPDNGEAQFDQNGQPQYKSYQLNTAGAEQLVNTVHQDLVKTLLKADAPLPKVLSVRLWNRAIPQYNLGHRDRLNQLQAGLSHLSGMYLCTNYLDGVAVGDCVRRANTCAQDIISYISNS